MVNRVSPRPTERLTQFIDMFCSVRFLWDYAEDGKLLVRLNQVLCRVGLPPLDGSLLGFAGRPRAAVARRADELLAW